MAATAPRAPTPARVLLGLALLLGLTRFLGLGTWGLWIDEAHTLNDAAWFFSRTPQDYPLGYLATAAMIWLRGGAIDEATLRLFPALCGWLSIPLTAWALRPAVGPTRAAAAALLVSVSSWHLFWSQSARAYTLALLLSVLAGGLWLRGLSVGRRPLLVLGFLLAAGAAFAHPSAALLLPAWVLAPLLVPLTGARIEWAAPARLLGVLAVVGLLALGGWGLGVWSTYERVKSGASVVHFASTTGWYVTPLYLLAALVGVAVALSRRVGGDVLIALVVLLAGSLALAAATVAKVAAQYVFVLLPWIAALATVPLLAPGSVRPRWAWIALLALPPAADSVFYFAARHGDRPRWREAYAYVWEQRGPLDAVLGMHAPVGEYYLRPGTTWLRTQEALVTLDQYNFELGVMSRLRREGRRIWVVLNPEDLMAWDADARAAFLQLLAEEGRLLRSWPVPWTPRDLEVRVYSLG